MALAMLALYACVSMTSVETTAVDDSTSRDLTVTAPPKRSPSRLNLSAGTETLLTHDDVGQAHVSMFGVIGGTFDFTKRLTSMFQVRVERVLAETQPVTTTLRTQLSFELLPPVALTFQDDIDVVDGDWSVTIRPGLAFSYRVTSWLRPFLWTRMERTLGPDQQWAPDVNVGTNIRAGEHVRLMVRIGWNPQQHLAFNTIEPRLCMMLAF